MYDGGGGAGDRLSVGIRNAAGDRGLGIEFDDGTGDGLARAEASATVWVRKACYATLRSGVGRRAPQRPSHSFGSAESIAR